MIEAADLGATLSLLDAYARKEKAGAHFKDDEQQLPDAADVPDRARQEKR